MIKNLSRAAVLFGALAVLAIGCTKQEAPPEGGSPAVEQGQVKEGAPAAEPSGEHGEGEQKQ